MGIRFRGVVVVASTLASFLFAVLTGGSLAWHLFYFLLLLLSVVAYSQLGPLSKVAVTRRVVPGPYYAGSWIDVSLTVTATSWPWLHLVVVDHLQCADRKLEHQFVITTVGKREQSLGYRVADLQRGSLEFSAITLTTSDFFGLFQRSYTVGVDALDLRIWPAVLLLSRAEFNSYLWYGEQLNSRKIREEMTHLQGIREYVAGDRLSHVHWRTSAHTGEFKVKHFESASKAEFVVLLDGCKYFEPTDWELAVSIAASLIHKACRSQLQIRVVALDRTLWTAASSTGSGALAKMMDFLSSLPASGQFHGNPVEPTRYGRHVLVISTMDRRSAWQGLADSVVVVGRGGVSSLASWRASLVDDAPRSRSLR